MRISATEFRNSRAEFRNSRTEIRGSRTRTAAGCFISVMHRAPNSDPPLTTRTNAPLANRRKLREA
jgi:hypothetical protein